MTPEKYRNLLKKFIETKFASRHDAALSLRNSQATISQVLNGKRSPTPAMLEATGHERIERPSTINYRKVVA